MKTKKTITVLALALGIFASTAQVTVADFETFTLSPNSAYSPTTSTPFQTSNASFNYYYDFGFWLGGFAYTNDYDSITAGFTNLYGVRALKGYNNSSIYVVGQDGGVITTTAVPQTTVAGFYVTNTTYAYKSMAKGDGFSRKFGDTTGTGSGTTIPQGSYPDYFKLIVKGYNNGALKNDSVTVMLADFTFTNNAQDFILSSWQFVNTAIIGEVDSIQFVMRSSDTSDGFINTPTFFAIDNFTTGKLDFTGISKFSYDKLNATVSPNPFNSSVSIKIPSGSLNQSKLVLTDNSGKIIRSLSIAENEHELDMSDLCAGVYFLEISNGDRKTVKKLVKN